MRGIFRFTLGAYWRAALTCVCLGTSAGIATADVSDVFFSIQATTGSLTGTFEVLTDDVFFNPSNDSWMWFGSGISINDDVSGAPIATLNSAFILIQSDPQVNMTFNVQAGAASTMFMVSTATLSFPAIANPQAQASVGFTLTDSDPFGAGDGNASITGNGPNGGSYVAEYNTPPGTIFTEQMQSLTITGDPSGSASFNAADPPSGFASLSGPVDSMRAFATFTLSAFDQASSTSQFTIVPEPGSALALLLGLVALRRR